MDSTPVFETEIAGSTPVSPKSFTVNHFKVVIFLSIYVKLQSSKTLYVFCQILSCHSSSVSTASGKKSLSESSWVQILVNPNWIAS